MTAGYCRCGNRSYGTDICDRCQDEADHAEDFPRPRFNPAPSNVRIPYDPETDPF